MKTPGLFSVPFTCKGKVCDSSQRILRRYGRRPPGRLCLPSGRPGRSPLNSRRPARMPPGTARVRRRSASSLVVRGRAEASLTTRRKVSRSHVDSGKDRPRHDASAARVHAAEILIRAQRPPAAPSVNISLRVLAYMQSPRPAGSCIAVPSVSAALELRAGG